MSLVDKIRKAREVGIEVNGMQFTIRRPTDEEALRISRADSSLLDVVKQFTIGWQLTELDVIPGGTGAKIAFDAELFCEWVADQPLVWEPIGKAIMTAYEAHAKKRDETVKN
jgi:hypothetical protein